MSLWAASFAQKRRTFSLNDGWQTVLVDSTYIADGRHDNQRFYSEVKSINIPHNWDDYYGYRRMLHGNLHASALYKKSFSINKEKGKRYFLFFEGVGSYATVWVNNRQVGYHAGGRTTFTIDITNQVKNSGVNYLVVRADHPANIKNLPWVCGGCSDERGFSEGSQPLGIFRPVSLIVTNDVRVEPFGVHAWAEVKPDHSLLNIDVSLKNYGSLKSSISITHSILDKANKLVAQVTKGYHLKGTDSFTISTKSINVKNPVLWSVENPYLYKIKTTVKSANKIIDEVETDFGFRTVQWRTPTNQFFLNGKPVFINGVAEYEHLLGQSHAFSNEQVLSRMKWLQAAGFNAFRDAHQPHNLLYGKYFNEHGILWWTQLSAHIWYDTPEFRENFKKLLRDWVIERRNDPSIVMWGLQNESKLPKDFAEECTKLIRSLDPTASSQRLVTTCNGGEGTDWDVPQNWTGTYGGNPDTYGEDLKKQILVGEYGAWRTLDLHTEGGFVQNAPVSEDRFTQLMEKKIRLAESVKDSVAGHYFWLLTSHDNPGRVQGGEGYRELDRVGPVNYKGMLTPWEEPTDVFYMFRSNYVSAQKEPMVYIASHTWPNKWMQPGIKDSIIVYSNCDEVELFNDIDNASLGKQKRSGIGTHFIWVKVNIQYNLLYAVGYVNGKPVARDTVVLHHLSKAPNFEKLYLPKTNVLKPVEDLNYIYRLNCGGGYYEDEFNSIWSADATVLKNEGSKGKNQMRFETTSWASSFPGTPLVFASQRRTFSPVKGTKDWKLFQTFRYGKDQLHFYFPLSKGEYIVELYFIEPWLGIGSSMDAKGMRLFDVAFNDQVVLKDLDIWKEVGCNKALKKSISFKVGNEGLTIHFPRSNAGQAIISAIAVASKNQSITAAPAYSNVTIARKENASVESWMDIGDKVFLDKPFQINRLPPSLFGAQWIKRMYDHNSGINFFISQESDVYIAVNKKDPKPVSLKDFESTGVSIITDEGGKKEYPVYKKRFKPSEKELNFNYSKNWIVAIIPASNMQPAYDLKSITSYKADVAVMSDGVMKEVIANNDRSVVKTNKAVQVEWPVKTGVADIYSIAVKYNWPFEKAVNGKLELFDAGGSRMLEEEIIFKFTREGKWNFITVNTGSMINAGNYKVRLSVQDAQGLILSNIDVQ